MIKNVIAAVIALGVLIGAAAGLWVWGGLKTLEEPAAIENPLLFDVASGSSVSRVALRLEDQGVIEDPFWLKLHARLHPEQAHIKAGEYELMPGMTPLGILGKMIRGETKTWTVQLIEGTRFSDVRQVLASNPQLTHETTGWESDRLMAALGAPDIHPEGRFFPDTYVFEKGTRDLDILQWAFDRMDVVLAREWEQRQPDLPYESPYEALIMASIVEKETGVPSERDEVAGVFVRRLARGMRLQTDPTVIYGMGDRYDGNIRRADLLRHTPYNTYRVPGLPPTPIALPGREAIHAALNPADGDALYFVARGDGSHVFSATLKEHQNAVREYQLRRRDDYRSSPAPGGNR